MDPGEGEVGLWVLEQDIGGFTLPYHYEDPEVGGFIVDLYAPTLNTGVPNDAYDDSAWNDGEIVNSHLPVDRSEGQTRIDFVKVGLDLDAILLYAATLAATGGAKGIGGGLEWSFGNSLVGVDLTLLDATLEAYLGLGQTMTFDPMMKVDLNFQDADGQPKAVSLETYPGSGMFETVTTKRIDVGEDIEIIHSGGDLKIDTDYVLDGTFSNNTAIYLSPAFTLTVMELGISTWIWDWNGSLYDNTFALGDPIRVATLFDESFPLLGFGEVDGGDLVLPAALPTTFEVTADANHPTITEGEEIVITGTILDPDGTMDGSDTYTLEINWQDGDTQTVTLDSDTTELVPGVTFDPMTHVFSAAHQYADDIGLQLLSITVTGTTGQTDNLTLPVEVTNFAPTLSIDQLLVGPSGAATLTGSYTDTGVEDSHTMTVAWGDSTSTQFNVEAIGTLDAGQTFTSNAHMLTVTSVNASTGQVEFSVVGHDYSDSTVSSALVMTVDDADGGTDFAQTPVHWGLSLAIVSHTADIFEDDIAHVAFDFTDVFPPDTPSQQYKLVVDWDDANNPAVSTFYVDVDFSSFLFREGWWYPSTTDDAVLYVTGVERTLLSSEVEFKPTFRIEHRYADNGFAAGNGTPPDPNDVVVEVMERDGPQGGMVIGPITVHNVAPTLTLNPTEKISDSDVTRLSGTIDDVGRLDAFELYVNWGDDSTYDNDDDPTTADDEFELFTMAPSATGTQKFDVYHIYADALFGVSYAVAASVYDGDEQSDTATVDVDKAAEFDMLVVDTTQDESDGNFGAGDLSLREAIELANANPGRETITFAADLADSTILLNGDLGQLEIVSDLDLLGQNITLDAGGSCRVLFVDAAVNDALVSGVTISGGSAAGGGILNNGTLSLVGSTISGNTAVASGNGGGVLNQGTLSLVAATISGNSADPNGGGVFNSGTVSIVNSTIEDNMAASSGGGIYNSGELSAANSTIVGNSAGTSGGGIFNDGTLVVVNSTIAMNSADGNQNSVGAGGGIRTENGNSTTLHNSIVAGNTRGTAAIADDLSDISVSGTPVQADSSYNLIGDANTSGGLMHDVNGNQVGVDSGLDPAGLQDHGGPTRTIALLPGSPAINQGSNELAATSLPGLADHLENLTLVEEGPAAPHAPGDVPDNLALASSGAVAFASSDLGPEIGTTYHVTENLNDGSYGNEYSWIGGSAPDSFAGIDLGTTPVANIQSIAFGRSNVLDGDSCGGGVCTDRHMGLYTIQYTQVASPSGNLNLSFTGDPATGWAQIGTVDYGQSEGFGTLYDRTWLRHRYNFNPVDATGLRILVPETGSANGSAIDEIELYDVPGDTPLLEFDQRGVPFARSYGEGQDDVVDVGAYEVQVLVVDTLDDESDRESTAGDFSLREAIELANAIPGADTIVFAADLAGNIINLTGGELAITDDLTITGLGADQLTISGNSASRVFSVDSAASEPISVAIRSLSLVDGYNAGSSYGGGIYNDEILVLDSCTLANNLSDYGGGIRNDGMLTVTNSTFVDNSAGTTGGATFNMGTLTVTNSTFADNSAHSGGGITNFDSGTLTLTNSTLANNAANYSGGGIQNHGTLTVRNSTLANNSAGSYGGGIENVGGLTEFGSLTLTNSLLGGNTAPQGPDLRIAGEHIAAQYNVIQDGTGSGLVNGVDGNLVGVDPKLDPAGLQDHGGPTPTIALLSGSAAIDAGDNAAAAGLTGDQRGVPFVRDYGDGADDVVDVGAYEVQPLVVDTVADENDEDHSAGNLSLRETIALANAIPGTDSIVFAADLAGTTIRLTGGELVITDDLTITGLGAEQLTISGNHASRILYIKSVASENSSVMIRDLSLEDGYSPTYPYGGGIHNDGSLVLDSCRLANNFSGYGGGIRNDGVLTVTNSTFVGNSASPAGGAIINDGTLTVTNSTLADNSGAQRGGHYKL